MTTLLQALGNLVDLPASMGRDLMSGNNPLDQLMSPLDPENRVSGPDVLESWGMGPGHNVLGTALELATDPLTYFGLGAAGKAAKVLGLGKKASAIAGRTKAAKNAVDVAMKTPLRLERVLSEALQNSPQKVAELISAARSVDVGSLPYRFASTAYNAAGPAGKAAAMLGLPNLGRRDQEDNASLVRFYTHNR